MYEHGARGLPHFPRSQQVRVPCNRVNPRHDKNAMTHFYCFLFVFPLLRGGKVLCKRRSRRDHSPDPDSPLSSHTHTITSSLHVAIHQPLVIAAVLSGWDL